MILSKNAKVAILAPSAQIGDIGKIEKGLNYLKSIGLVPVLGENTLKQYRYMAGTDKQRADDINSAFADSEIKAILEKLAEEFRYSDPVSSDETKEIEAVIAEKIRVLKDSLATDSDESLKAKIVEIKRSLADRNRICKATKR